MYTFTKFTKYTRSSPGGLIWRQFSPSKGSAQDCTDPGGADAMAETAGFSAVRAGAESRRIL